MNNNDQKIMDEYNDEIFFSFETKVDNNGIIKIPSKEFKKLITNNIFEIIVEIRPKNIFPNLNDLDINEKVFNRIKEVQGLPEDIVLNFLKSKGKIKNKNFMKSITDEEK